MALSLGVSVRDRIAIGDSVVEIRAIHFPKSIVVSVNGANAITLGNNKANAVEILPGVRAFVGIGPGKRSNAYRLAFEAPRIIPIYSLPDEALESAPSLPSPGAGKTAKAQAETALFINGIYEETLAEILKSQKAHPELQHYLQPYSSSRIVLLAELHPKPEKPIELYFSLTDSLNLVSYRAKAVGWYDKRKLTSDDLVRLNEHIHKHQRSEEEIYLTTAEGKPCVNLILITGVQQVQFPFSTSCLIKADDGMPLKRRDRAGHWAYVRKVPDWLGAAPQAVLDDVDEEFAKRVFDSLKGNSALRRKRLANAPKLPALIQVVSRVYHRNPDVVAEVLIRAKGKCEACQCPAPFSRASDGSPYLEVHHRIMLSQGGEDTVENAWALCPNCHRKLHFGETVIVHDAS